MAYVLERQQLLPRPVDEIFPFFADARNLERITPPWLGFRILTPEPIEMGSGTRIEYRIRIAGVPVRWRTVIRDWKPGERFADEQESGPYAVWHHEHDFVATSTGTLMTDRVTYRLPFGPLGRIAHGLWVHSALARIFDYRYARVRELLG